MTNNKKRRIDPRIEAMKEAMNETDDYETLKEIGNELFFNDPKPKKSFTQFLKDMGDK